MSAGFVHGVLNTDNINVTGESFDYGPWRFAPTFDPNFTAAYFDEQGLYAFGRQPNAVFWNLARLAECLLPFSTEDDLTQALSVFEPTMQAEYGKALLERLGLEFVNDASTAKLAGAWIEFLFESQAPFEQAHFDWYGGLLSEPRATRSPSATHYTSPHFNAVRDALADHRPKDAARIAHPYFADAQPCSMLIDEVEAIWKPIAEQDDWSLFEAKLQKIAVMKAAYAL